MSKHISHFLLTTFETCASFALPRVNAARALRLLLANRKIAASLASLSIFFNAISPALADRYNSLRHRPNPPFNGNLHGLSDTAGNQLVAPKYSQMLYCRNGIYQAREVDPRDKYAYGADVHFFNSEGTELKYVLPKGTRFAQLLSLGATADADLSLGLTTLPDNTVLMFEVNNGCGLCLKSGKIIFAAQPNEIKFWKPGFACLEVGRDGEPEHIEKSVELPSGKVAVLKSGQIPTSIWSNVDFRRPSDYREFGSDWPTKPLKSIPARMENLVSIDSGKFDSSYWSHGIGYWPDVYHRPSNNPVRRLDMFCRLLKEYDLIGMKEEQLFELLGPGTLAPTGYKGEIKTASFAIEGRGGCRMPPPLSAKVHFTHGIVDSWCFTEDKDSEWVTTNVVAVPSRSALPEIRAK